MTTKPLDVAVVGGGMGGLCVAIGCLKHPNLNVQVYEAAHQFSEIGAGVAFGPNAQRALKLISDETEQAYLSQATHNKWEKYSNTFFQYRMGMGPHEGKIIASAKNETGQSTVHRAKFLNEFVKLVPPDVSHFGKRLDRLEELDSGRIRIHFKDDTQAEADCVIGADGIHSVTKRYILGENDPAVEPVFTGSVAFRGLVPMEDAVKAVGEEYAENSFILCGDDAGLMTYPIDFGETLNIVAIDSSYKTWEGAWVQKADFSKVEKVYENWGEDAQKMIKLLDTDRLTAWSLWDTKPAATFYKGNVAMMGDAAHASTPFQGQGAAQAIEDAYVMESVMALVQKPEDIIFAFKAYDYIRRPRSQRVCTTSREMGEIAYMRHPHVGHDLDKFKENVEWRMDWMWHRDVDGERREAELIFKKLKTGGTLDDH